MSFLSDQQPGSPFSDYGEVCKEPSLSPAVPAPAWDWQHSPSLDISTPRSLMVASGALATTGLTDEDKLCFFEAPGRGTGELMVPGKVGLLPGSSSLENASLGSVAESPVSPLSSSLSPSLASPGRLPSAMTCGSPSGVCLEQPHPTGASLIDQSLAIVESPPEEWNKSAFGECSPMVAVPQVSLNYGVSGVNREDHVETPDEEGSGREAGKRPVAFPEVKSDSEEEDSDSEPCSLGQARQERKALRRAMSECSHLTVPTTLELQDRYPGEKDPGPQPPFSPSSRSGCSPSYMKRSLTVAGDRPPTPPSCLASGTASLDLWQDPPEPRLRIPPFSPLNDSEAASPLSDPGEALTAEKELSGVVYQDPPGPGRAADFDFTPPTSASSSTEEEGEIYSELAASHRADAQRHPGCSGVALKLEGVAKSRVGGESLDEITPASFICEGWGSRGNAFITTDGRWSLIFKY